MALLQLGQIDVLGNNGHDGTMTDGRPLGPRALSGREHEFQLCLPLSTKASAVSIFLLSLSLFLNQLFVFLRPLNVTIRSDRLLQSVYQIKPICFG